MSDTDCKNMEHLFALLNRWRHLPFYRLEPRTAPFFALFLRDVLRQRFKVDMHPIVIPEFPLPLGTLYQEGTKGIGGKHQSKKVDYVAFSKDRHTVFFVELKTDEGSRREDQDCYLKRAQCRELCSLVDGILEVCKASNKKQKYFPCQLHKLPARDRACFIKQGVFRSRWRVGQVHCR